MRCAQNETTAPASAAASISQFTAPNNSGFVASTQYHPHGPSANCSTCSAGCVVWPDGDPRHAFVQCRRGPHFSSHTVTFWCRRWAPRWPPQLVPAVRR